MIWNHDNARERLARRAKELCPEQASAPGIFGGYCTGVRCKAMPERKSVEIQGIATTGSIDQSGEVIVPDGGDWSPLLMHKSIFADHFYGLADRVGTLRWIKRQGKGWEFAFTLTQNGSAASANILAIAEEDALSFSVGFIPLEWGVPTTPEVKAYGPCEIIHRRWIGFEISVVAMPCNLDCVGGRIHDQMDSTRAARLAAMVTKGMIDPRALTVPSREFVVHRAPLVVAPAPFIVTRG